MSAAHQLMEVARWFGSGFETRRLRCARLFLRPVLYALIEATIIVVMAHCIAQNRVYTFSAVLFNNTFDVVFKVRMLRMISAGQIRS